MQVRLGRVARGSRRSRWRRARGVSGDASAASSGPTIRRRARRTPGWLVRSIIRWASCWTVRRERKRCPGVHAGAGEAGAASAPNPGTHARPACGSRRDVADLREPDRARSTRRGRRAVAAAGGSLRRSAVGAGRAAGLTYAGLGNHPVRPPPAPAVRWRRP